MFSSIASFIFGSNTSASATATSQQPASEPANQVDHGATARSLQPEENTIQVTSLTPSVTGSTTTSVYRGGKRAKNKRQRQQAKRQLQQQQQQQPKKKTPSITKLLTPSAGGEESCDDDDDWFIVEKEEEHDDDEEESLPRTDDSEEDAPVVEVVVAAPPKAKPPTHEPAVVAPPPAPQQPQLSYAVVAASANARHATNGGNVAASSRRRPPHLTSHSLYGGPRPQQQRHNHHHLHQRMQRPNVSLALLGSPPRGNSPIDGGVTQSLYVASPEGAEGFGGVSSMEESWFVTPPPCFTSIGPIHMETSPFENLLIEHPSMSVYHSIRSAQEATESFVNLDLGVEESQQAAAAAAANHSAAEPRATGGSAATTVNNGPVAPRRTATGARIDRFSAAQLKQELMARHTQKNREEKERQNLCRSAIKRANKVRDYQGKGKCQRRADLQHSKVLSGANNNRKCCY